MNRPINFTRAKLEALERDYNAAKQHGADQFEFEGHVLLVAYAKYLIEYLRGAFHPDTRSIEAPVEPEEATPAGRWHDPPDED